MTLTDQPTINNRYRILGQIGAGGMGAVYRALDRLTGETVALKRVLLPSNQPGATPTTEHDELLLSLSREFRTLAGLRHPHIISVLNYGFDSQRQPYFTMSLLDKPQTIAEAAETKPLPEKVHLLVEMLQALSYLHRRGIVHRDLKPGNVLVDTTGVKVLDFGLALVARSTSELQGAAGTLAYMAPELLMEQAASVASDLYAVGVMACEILRGKHPFVTNSIGELITQVLSAPPDLSGLEGNLAEVIERLLAKSPSERYSHADAALVALCQAADQPLPPESQAVRESFLQASEFVGREVELRQLTDSLESVVETALEGMVWLIGGESGVGKSRLLDELRIRALVKGAVVLRGQAVAEGGLPYQLWREVARELSLSTSLSDLEAGILKEIVPDIGLLLGREVAAAPELMGPAGQQRLMLTLVDMLKRQTQPLVLLLEDLQWAGESLALIKQILAVREQFSHLLLLGTYRDDERPHLPGELPGAKTMKLPRLTDEAIADLAQSMLGEAGTQAQVLTLLKRETEGNAFFMVETVRALAEEAGRLSDIGRKVLPEKILVGGVQQIVRRRLSRAPEWTQPMLKLAAVAGRELDLKVLAVGTRYIASAQNDLDAFLTACADAAVLEIADGRWRFSHDKLRETLINDFSTDERRDLNRQVAEAIEAAYPDDEGRAAALVEHWGAAGNVAREAHYAALAGEQFTQIGRFREALTLVERGLKVVTDLVSQIHLLNLAADAHMNLSDYAAATERYQTSLSLAQSSGERHGQAVALRGLGRVAEKQSDYATAQGHAQDSLAIYHEIGDQQGIATCLSNLGNVAYYQSDYTTARSYLEESLTIRREVGDRSGLASCLNNLGNVAKIQGDYVIAQSYLEDSLSIYREIGDRKGIAISLSNLSNLAMYQRNYTIMNARIEEGLAIWREVGDRAGIAFCLSGLGDVARQKENYVAARGYYGDALAIYRDIGNRYGMMVNINTLGDIACDQSDYPSAQRYYQDALTISREIGDQYGIAFSLNGLGNVAYFQADYSTAYPYFEESLAIRRDIGDRSGIANSLNNLGDMGFQQRDYAAARKYYEESLAIYRDLNGQSGIASSACNLGFTLLALYNLVPARQNLHEALQLALEIGEVKRVLEVVLGFARLYYLNGQTSRCVELSGLVAQNTTKNPHMAERLQSLRTDLEAALPPDELAVALERGKTLDLDTVVKQLLAESDTP